MNQQLIIYPIFAMVLLTTIVLIVTFLVRVKAVRQRRVHVKYFKAFQGEDIPESMIVTSRNIQNLFEVPVLFYIAAILIYFDQRVDVIYIILAWSYVALRYIHSLIHLTYNRVTHRLAAYAASSTILLVMWVRLAIQIIR